MISGLACRPVRIEFHAVRISDLKKSARYDLIFRPVRINASGRDSGRANGDSSVKLLKSLTFITLKATALFCFFHWVRINCTKNSAQYEKNSTGCDSRFHEVRIIGKNSPSRGWVQVVMVESVPIMRKFCRSSRSNSSLFSREYEFFSAKFEFRPQFCRTFVLRGKARMSKSHLMEMVQLVNKVEMALCRAQVNLGLLHF